MATEVIASSVGELRSLTTAGGGTSLAVVSSGVGTLIPFPEGIKFITVTPRIFATAVVAQFAFSPYLRVVKRAGTFTAANLSDASSAVQDADTGTSLSLNSFDAVGNNNFIYIGSHVPFRGARVTIGNTNAGSATVLTVKYWKSDSTWADITATDGTTTGGKSFAQSGNVTWTVPTDWITTKLIDADNSGAAVNVGAPVGSPDIYWTRWQVDVIFDSTVTATQIQALNRSTAYWEQTEGQPMEMKVKIAPGGVSGIEAATDNGTAKVIINGGTVNDDMQGNLP